jgi:hypothetical protein
MTESDGPTTFASIDLPEEACAVTEGPTLEAVTSLREGVEAKMSRMAHVASFAVQESDIELWLQGNPAEAGGYLRDIVLALSETFGLTFQSDGPGSQWGADS